MHRTPPFVLSTLLALSIIAGAAGAAGVAAEPPAVASAPAPVPSASAPASASTASTSAAKRVIVLCAPGYTGNTAQAQPTMDLFARAVEKALKAPAGTIGAIYFETEAGGMERLAQASSVLAVVPLPFMLKHTDELKLEPRLVVAQESGPAETWSLLAQRGRLRDVSSLVGWEVTGGPGYAPPFVRGTAFGGWGTFPDSARITFTTAILSALRRAAGGEKVAVVLDATQVSALGTLPFGAALEVVARSQPLPGSLVCLAGGRLKSGEAAAILDALLHLDETAEGAEALRAMRMVRFEPADRDALDAARRAFTAAAH
jgi:hypothetical protein